jgi:hypothetical protein
MGERRYVDDKAAVWILSIVYGKQSAAAAWRELISFPNAHVGTQLHASLA